MQGSGTRSRFRQRARRVCPMLQTLRGMHAGAHKARVQCLCEQAGRSTLRSGTPTSGKPCRRQPGSADRRISTAKARAEQALTGALPRDDGQRHEQQQQLRAGPLQKLRHLPAARHDQRARQDVGSQQAGQSHGNPKERVPQRLRAGRVSGQGGSKRYQGPVEGVGCIPRDAPSGESCGRCPRRQRQKHEVLHPGPQSNTPAGFPQEWSWCAAARTRCRSIA